MALTIDCGEGRHEACRGAGDQTYLIPQLDGEEFDCGCRCHKPKEEEKPMTTLEPGDNVLIRGIYRGPGEVRPEDNHTVDVFSNSTQYPVQVRCEDVQFLGPDWWPPQAGDVVIQDGLPWVFADFNGRLVAHTIEPSAERDDRHAETWRRSFLVVRGGEMTV